MKNRLLIMTVVIVSFAVFSFNSAPEPYCSGTDGLGFNWTITCNGNDYTMTQYVNGNEHVLSISKNTADQMCGYED